MRSWYLSLWVGSGECECWCELGQTETAVNNDCLPRHVAGSITNVPDECCRQLHRITPATHQGAVDHEFEVVPGIAPYGGRGTSLRHFGKEPTWSDCVDSDPARSSPFLCEVTGESEQARLAGRISRLWK